MPKLQNGPLRAAPTNPGGKTAHGKVPSDLGHLAPLWRNLVHKCFAGNFLETSRKLPGRQPAAPQNLMMGQCALQFHAKKSPTRGCSQIWAGHCRGTPQLGNARLALATGLFLMVFGKLPGTPGGRRWGVAWGWGRGTLGGQPHGPQGVCARLVVPAGGCW